MSHMGAFVSVLIATLIALLLHPFYSSFTGAKGLA